MFSIRFTYFPNCIALVRERWASLHIPFETDVDGDWRPGRGSLAAVDAFCRRRGFTLVSVSESIGQYTLSFNDKEGARLAYDEATYNEIQEARWAMS